MGSTDESPPPIHTTARLSVDLPTNRVPKQQRRPHQQPQSRKSTNTTDASGGESRLQQFVRKRRQQLLLQKQQQQQQQRSGFVTTTAASEDDSDDMLALPKKRKIEPTNATEVVAHPTLAREDPAGPAFGIVLMTSENAQTADATTEKESQNDDKKQNNCRQSIRDEVEVQEIEPTCLGSLPVLDEFPSHSDHNSDQASTTNHRLENNDDVGELWHCPKCTLLHMMTIRRCTLCGGRRPLSLINDVRAPEASLRRKKKSISSHASKLDRKYVNSSKEHTTPPSSSKNDEHFRNPIVDNTSEYEKTEMKPTSNKELHTLQHSMQTVAPTNEMSSSDSRGDLSSSRMPAVLTQKESMNVFLAPHSDSIHHSSTDSTRCPGNRDIPCELNRKNASCKDSFHEMDRWSNPTRDMVYPFIHPPHDRLDYDQRLEGIMKHILEKMEKCDNLDRFVTGQEHTYEIMNKLRDLETRQQFIMTELHEIRQQNQTILQWHQEMRTSQINWKSDTASNQSNQSLMDQVKAFLEERTILNAKEDGFKQQMATLSEIKVLGAHIMRLETKLDECKLSAVTVHNSTTVSKGFGDRLADVKTTPSHSGIAINNKLLATSEVISTTDEPARVVRPHPTSKARQSKKPISSKTKSTCETSYGTFDVVSLRKSTDQLSEQSAGTFADTTNESTNGRISPSISSGYKKSDVDFSQDCDEAKVNWARLLGAASEHLAGSSFSIRGGMAIPVLLAPRRVHRKLHHPLRYPRTLDLQLMQLPELKNLENIMLWRRWLSGLCRMLRIVEQRRIRESFGRPTSRREHLWLVWITLNRNKGTIPQKR